ncbi:hypothetical protein CPB84DRAFT_1788479 [Gymnopilus junonius]|uniref:Uncharacterized protein n=1 Tax=Gymnopilus junonius TaxID=109634 RepID=A0A9P5NHA8_GYMJU|nr:hypothetical protein CPB84DRAFT_1788479 [Gymnopilus junonius]
MIRMARSSSPIATLARLRRTLILFTYTDFKTILLPVFTFASITAPVSSTRNGIIAGIWIWVHLLQCNVSNQCNSAVEDRINHPWRPIPAGLISESNAHILRWALAILCPCFSSIFGFPTVLSSMLMTTTMILYDNFNFAGHWASKNLCSFFAYLCFEVGAVMIMGNVRHLDAVALRALVSSGLVILSTIHIQDFADGNISYCRPTASRILTCVLIPFWSIYNASAWGIGIWSSFIFYCVGFVVAWRIYFFRTMHEDRNSYVAYNVWLMILHLLPANARWRVFSS